MEVALQPCCGCGFVHVWQLGNRGPMRVEVPRCVNCGRPLLDSDTRRSRLPLA